MALNYKEFSENPRSQKITLCTVETKHQRKIFSGGPVYSISSDYFVCGVTVDGVELTSSNSEPSPGQFFYNPETNVTRIRLLSDADPNQKRVFLKYRLFFSTIPVAISTPYSNNSSVSWDSRIVNQPSLRLELDSENSGTVLETNSQISLENTDGFFDGIFDRFIWEGQKVNVYSWSEVLDTSEIKLFYRGKIESKTFTDRSVSFNIRDEVNDLRQKVPYSTFSSSDGRVSESDLNKPKRKIFGQVEKIRTVGVDKVLSGYPFQGTIEGSSDRNLMTGTVSGNAGSSQISGAGTAFLSEISPGDEVLITAGIFEYTYTVLSVPSNVLLNLTATISTTFLNARARNKEILNNKIYGVGTNFKQILSPDDELITFVDGVEYEYRIETVNSDLEITLSDEIEATFTAMSVVPSVPYRGYNRRWHIAGHKLRSVTHEVVAVIDESNIELDSVAELFEGDTIVINLNYRKIVRITGLKIRINQSLGGVSAGNTINKIPVPLVHVGEQPLLFGRDYTTLNTADNCIIVVDPLAEFNNAKNRSLSISFNFTNGSDLIVATSTDRDLTGILKPRDWIRSRDITHQVWYEVLSVGQLEVRIRVPYAGPNYLGQFGYRSPAYIADSSLVTADCLGMEWQGEWVKTPSQAVLQMLESIGVEDINSQSFADALSDCQYIVSLALPASVGSEMPALRDAISLINKSCFGSLYFNGDFQFTYKILNASKPQQLQSVTDSDIIGFAIQTRNQILGFVRLSYRPFVDLSTGSETFKQIFLDSDFVEETSGIRREESVTAYLYNDEDARTIAERWRFFRSLSQTSVKVRAKLNFMLIGLNEPVFVDLERIFRRYGGNGRKKIGIVSGVDKDGDSTSITFNDLGNVFNRVPAISPDLQTDYSVATSDEIAKYGFVVDNETETPDSLSEADLGNNLIG
jgi:hypothetical protein